MDLSQELRYLADAPELKGKGEFVFLRQFGARSAAFGSIGGVFYQKLLEQILPNGLYKHQSEAISLIDAGNHVVVSTSTASGKSLCYQLPIAKAIMGAKKKSLRPKALVIHPTKALAHDQLKGWAKLKLPGLAVSTYDGDSTAEQRHFTKRIADVWLTNPEMINSSILAHHGQYIPLLSRLEYVVVDEAHSYRGVFGSHVANLLRRLIRVAGAYGSNPTFIFTSATIAQPDVTCARLINQEVLAVEEDFSPRSEQVVAIWKPKITDQAQGTRSSYSRASAAISAHLSANDHRIITFVRSRKMSEIVANEVRSISGDSEGYEILSYRGGYLPIQRRDIEDLVASGTTKVLVSTSAMELGIDIGSLDVVVIAGFPGTFSSFRQQAGRVGREGQSSATILVCGPDALDQWISTNSDSLFEQVAERCVINPSNPFILRQHLMAACFEKPLSVDELPMFAPAHDVEQVKEVLDDLEKDDAISYRQGKYVTNSTKPPHYQISMRSSSSRQVLISSSDGELIGTAEFDKAPSTLHQGSIYLHLGQSFKVDYLDLERDVAIVSPYSGNEQTRTIFDTHYENLDSEKTRSNAGVSLCLGRSKITQHVTGYQVLSGAGEILSTVSLDLPPTILDTRAFWLAFEPDALREIEVGDLPGALHAAEHAMISMMPLFAICDRSDIGGVSKMLVPDPFDPEFSNSSVATITIYDGYSGGVGIAELGFDVAETLIHRTITTISSCPCDSGCPSCVQSPKCGNLNSPLGKPSAVKLLSEVLIKLGGQN